MAGMTVDPPCVWVTDEKRKMAAGRERKKRCAELRNTFPSEQFLNENPLCALCNTASRARHEHVSHIPASGSRYDRRSLTDVRSRRRQRTDGGSPACRRRCRPTGRSSPRQSPSIDPWPPFLIRPRVGDVPAGGSQLRQRVDMMARTARAPAG
jgi:hypothetical protein